MVATPFMRSTPGRPLPLLDKAATQVPLGSRCWRGVPMLRWFWLLMAVAIALLPAAARPQPSPHRIIAIGDLHGDHAAWRAIARAAGLVDGKGRWTGANATLVQMGDIVDRGPDSLKIIRDLMNLQREAPRRGGRVVVLLGNHEAMMMT